MTTLEKFNRRIIELIHGLPYDEAIKKEKDNIGTEVKYTFDDYNEIKKQKITPYITIGRVMRALNNNEKKFHILDTKGNLYGRSLKEDWLVCNWKLTKENGQEADSSDQSKETLSRLLNLLN